jgi:adenylate cyclase
MARPRKWRHAAATALVCAVLAAVGSYVPGLPAWLSGLSFDLAVAATAPQRRTNVVPQVAVIAIDSASLDSPDLQAYPRALFGPVWALMIPALQEAGARVIAFDAVFSYSANRFSPEYDRTFLKALSGARDSVVIGYSSRLAPTQTHMAALGLDQGALGSLDLFAQEDGILRSEIGRRRTQDGEIFMGLAGAALARAGVDDIPEEIILAPDRHPEALPTYSLIEILRCAGTAPQALQAAFTGKIVFVGTNLPEEDRVVSSGRFLRPTTEAGPANPDCGLHALAASAPEAGDAPGVHLLATAAQSVLSGHIVTRADTRITAAVAGLAAIAGAGIGFALTPVLAAAAIAFAGALLWGAEAGLLLAHTWFDTAGAIIALFVAAIAAYLVRYVVEERSRRRIQNAFGRYLAPSLVDQLAEDAAALQLRGEQRDATIMFADLSGFTALSGKLGPQALVETTNSYLKIIADAVDESGGYVDKFIGDAVMAIWGAPAADPDHPVHGVETALKIAGIVAEKRAAAIACGDHAFDVKIGVNSGPVVVGNVGSERRYNYTAIGEAVNIAARLESLPGVYKCRVVIGPETAERVSNRFAMREIDQVTVKGKVQPLRIFEPLTSALQPAHEAYGEALRRYRDCDFKGAESIWETLAGWDGPASVMLERARDLAEDPPPAGWDGVFRMTEK